MEENIIAGNRLIAEFMGGKLKYYNISNEPYYLMPDKKQWMFERLVYNYDWNWLMAACRKFDKLNLMDKDYEALCDEIDNAVSCYEIKPAWKNLVKAITWHNSNK